MEVRRTRRERRRVASERMPRILRDGSRDTPRDESWSDDRDESGVSARYLAGTLDASSSGVTRREIDE